MEKAKLTVKAAFISLTALIFVSFLLVEGLILYHAFKRPGKEADAIIILGARVYGTTPSPALRHRLEEGLAYLLEHPDTLCVVSGGKGPGEMITEAEAMKRFLLEKGIPSSRILMEDQSTSTRENIINSKAILKARAEGNGPDFSVGIVTSGYHVFRGVLTAKEEGLSAHGIPSPSPPSIVIQGSVREFFAVMRHLLFFRS